MLKGILLAVTWLLTKPLTPFHMTQLVWIEVILVGGVEILRNTELDPEKRIYPGGYFDPLKARTRAVFACNLSCCLRQTECDAYSSAGHANMQSRCSCLH
jgi:hypothetical protein